MMFCKYNKYLCPLWNPKCELDICAAQNPNSDTEILWQEVDDEDLKDGFSKYESYMEESGLWFKKINGPLVGFLFKHDDDLYLWNQKDMKFAAWFGGIEVWCEMLEQIMLKHTLFVGIKE